MTDMSNTAIRAENLSKRYRIGLKEQIHETFGSAIWDFATRPVKNLRRLRRLSTFSDGHEDSEDIIWALRDVSLEVQQGEVVGLIGRNGAGKSTLLRILSKITEPTRGRALINGRVSSLLGVGTGFHPELTGRDNVYLNGVVLGMTRKEIDHKFDEIVDFSGVEKFIDTPVKRYSSGMQVRLAFAVAAYLEPDILLVDEVLAVGDIEFQKRCIGRMESIASGGRTVLFVSHNLGIIQQLCPTAILLEQGRITFQGGSLEAIGRYMQQFTTASQLDLATRTDRAGTGAMQFTGAKVRDEKTGLEDFVEAGNPATVDFKVRVNGAAPSSEPLVVLFTITDARSYAIGHLSTIITGDEIRPNGHQFTVSCEIRRVALNTGVYTIHAYIGSINGPHDYVLDTAAFQVIPGEFYPTGKLPQEGHSSTLLEYRWTQS